MLYWYPECFPLVLNNRSFRQVCKCFHWLSFDEKAIASEVFLLFFSLYHLLQYPDHWRNTGLVAYFWSTVDCMQPCSLRCRWTCQSVKTLVKTSKCSAYTLLDGSAYVWIFCELRSIVPSPAGVKKNTNDEQNARSHYMLNHHIRGLLFHYKKNCYFHWLLFLW